MLLNGDARIIAHLLPKIGEPVEQCGFAGVRVADQRNRPDLLLLGSLSGELAQMRLRKEKLEREIRNLTEAIADNGPWEHGLQGIGEREKEISSITDRLLASAPDSIETRVEDLKRLVDKGIENLGDPLKKNAPLAKQELHSHLLGVQMYPTQDGEGWYDLERKFGIL